MYITICSRPISPFVIFSPIAIYKKDSAPLLPLTPEQGLSVVFPNLPCSPYLLPCFPISLALQIPMTTNNLSLLSCRDCLQLSVVIILERAAENTNLACGVGVMVENCAVKPARVWMIRYNHCSNQRAS